MRSQRFEDRVQMQVIEAQSGCSALTLVSALTLKLQRKMNNLKALVLLGWELWSCWAGFPSERQALFALFWALARSGYGRLYNANRKQATA